MSGFRPLIPGNHGEAIRDLQRRLGGAGFAATDAEPGLFCASTEAAVRAFQVARGLHESGQCDEATWLALVEASWRLGDRPLKLVVPNMRGDDVSLLQTRLGRLGFDCGRVDGIFGELTATALEDFQRNCGLDVDGVCGQETARAVEINSTHTGTGPGVAAIRELESLDKVNASLRDLRIVVGQFGGLSSLNRSIAQELRARGAKVIAVDEFDPSIQAAAANRHAANVYIGFEARATPVATISYYSTPGFHSTGGHCLASHLARSVASVGALTEVTTAGMRLPVLRETRMTAVVCTVGPVRQVADAGVHLTDAVIEALNAWAIAPTELVDPLPA